MAQMSADGRRRSQGRRQRFARGRGMCLDDGFPAPTARFSRSPGPRPGFRPNDERALKGRPNMMPQSLSRQDRSGHLWRAPTGLRVVGC